MFNISKTMKNNFIRAIQEMAENDQEEQKIDNEFIVTTYEREKDVLLAKTEQGGKDYYLYQVDPR